MAKGEGGAGWITPTPFLLKGKDMGMKRIGLLLTALAIALVCCGVGYASSWNHTLPAKGMVDDCWVEVDDCWVEFESAKSNDPGKTIDPGYDKHIASTEVSIKNGCKRVGCWHFSQQDTLVVTVTNAYPSYQPTVDFWVKAYARHHYAHLVRTEINGTCATPGKPVDLGDLSVTVNPPQKIDARQSGKGNMTIHVEQSARRYHTYKFTVIMYYGFW